MSFLFSSLQKESQAMTLQEITKAREKGQNLFFIISENKIIEGIFTSLRYANCVKKWQLEFRYEEKLYTSIGIDHVYPTREAAEAALEPELPRCKTPGCECNTVVVQNKSNGLYHVCCSEFSHIVGPTVHIRSEAIQAYNRIVVLEPGVNVVFNLRDYEKLVSILSSSDMVHGIGRFIKNHTIEVK